MSNTLYIIRKTDNPSTRRAKKALRKKVKRKHRLHDQSRNPKSSFGRRKYSQDLERFISSNKKLLNSSKGKTIILDENFSLLNNPNETLFRLASFIKFTKSRSNKSKLIYKGFLSFGGLYLLDSLCWRVAERKSWTLHTHQMPEEDELFLKNLQSHRDRDENSEDNYLVNARVRINRDEKLLKRQIYEQKSKEVRDLVQKGVQENYDKNFEMSLSQHTAISSAITEHFDNIFQHAKKARFGNLCGYYNRIQNEVRVLIYNFGETIYENLNKVNLPDDMKEKVKEVIDNYTSKKYFVFNGISEENALTLLAIQEGISSKISQDPSRGHGIIDFVEHCFNISKGTEIRIISGNTAIKIDKKYSIKSQTVFGRTRRIIALNESNDIMEKPDKDYVEKMKVFFPGVIIETRIPLNN